jgi:methyl-accepting chemotaxis protein PixJ
LLQTKSQPAPNQSKQYYFQSALKSDRVTLSDVIGTEDQSVLYFTAPIREIATGRTIAILRATLPTRSLANLLPSVQNSYSILDSANRFVVASEQSRTAPTAFADSVLPDSKFWTDAQTQQRLFLTQTPIARIDQLPDLNWRILLSTPAERISQPSRLWILLFGSGAAIASGLLAILLAHILTRRFTMMTERVKKLSNGDLNTRLNITGNDEIAAFSKVIDQMADTIAKSMQDQAKSVQQLQQLNQAAYSIRRSINFDEIIQTGVREVRHLLNVDRAIVYLFDENWQGTIVAESVAIGFPAALGARIADPCFAERYIEKYRTGRTHAICNLEDARIDPCYREQLEAFNIKANLVAPMVVEGQLIGLLVAHQCSAPRQWEESETSLLVQIALHLGDAIAQFNLTNERQTALAQATLAQERQQQKEVLRLQLQELMKQAEKAASGDLTVRAVVSGEDIGTVADFFNAIVENLQQVVQQVKQSVLEVNSSLNQHETSVRSLSQDALKQAEETHLTLNCIAQMVRSIDTIANHAQQAAKVSQTAALTAEAGEFAMSETAESIAELRQSIGEATKKVKRLGESAQQISKAVLLINQIEMQTNVLAINAGIEATRTDGHQGFAMIAEEVSALAIRASAATHEISQLVSTIQQETIEVVEAMEKSTVQVVTGTQSVESAKQSLEQILQVSHQIDQIVHSISEATVSQVSTSNTVTHLMNTIAEVAEHTSSSSLEVSSSLRETVTIAKALAESVETFKVSP